MCAHDHVVPDEPVANKVEKVERSTGTLTRGKVFSMGLRTIEHLTAELQLRCNVAMCTGAFMVGVGEGETEGRIPFRDSPLGSRECFGSS